MTSIPIQPLRTDLAARCQGSPLTDRARFGESDRELGVVGVGELSMCGLESLVRPS